MSQKSADDNVYTERLELQQMVEVE